MSEWEVVNSFDSFHPLLVVVPFAFLVLKDLVGLDEGIDLVGLIFLLVLPFFVHLLTLELEQTLLVFSVPYLVNQLPVTFLMDLVNNLPKKVIVI